MSETGRTATGHLRLVQADRSHRLQQTMDEGSEFPRGLGKPICLAGGNAALVSGGESAQDRSRAEGLCRQRAVAIHAGGGKRLRREGDHQRQGSASRYEPQAFAAARRQGNRALPWRRGVGVRGWPQKERHIASQFRRQLSE